MKQCTIITYKHGIYELTHELPKDIRLGILGNQEIPGKCLNSIEGYPSAQNQNFVNTSKNS